MTAEEGGNSPFPSCQWIHRLRPRPLRRRRSTPGLQYFETGKSPSTGHPLPHHRRPQPIPALTTDQEPVYGLMLSVTDMTALTNCSYLHELLFPCADVRMPFTNSVLRTCAYIMAFFHRFERPCSLFFTSPLIIWDCAHLCDSLASAAALFLQNLIADISRTLFPHCELCRVTQLPNTAQTTSIFT